VLFDLEVSSDGMFIADWQQHIGVSHQEVIGLRRELGCLFMTVEAEVEVDRNRMNGIVLLPPYWFHPSDISFTCFLWPNRAGQRCSVTAKRC